MLVWLQFRPTPPYDTLTTTPSSWTPFVNIESAVNALFALTCTREKGKKIEGFDMSAGWEWLEPAGGVARQHSHDQWSGHNNEEKTGITNIITNTSQRKRQGSQSVFQIKNRNLRDFNTISHWCGK